MKIGGYSKHIHSLTYTDTRLQNGCGGNWAGETGGREREEEGK